MRKNGINHGIFPLVRQVLVEHPDSIRRDLEMVRPRHRRVGRLEPVVREPVAVLLLTTLLGWPVRDHGFWKDRSRKLERERVTDIGSLDGQAGLYCAVDEAAVVGRCLSWDESLWLLRSHADDEQISEHPDFRDCGRNGNEGVDFFAEIRD